FLAVQTDKIEKESEGHPRSSGGWPSTIPVLIDERAAAKIRVQRRRKELCIRQAPAIEACARPIAAWTPESGSLQSTSSQSDSTWTSLVPVPRKHLSESFRGGQL